MSGQSANRLVAVASGKGGVGKTVCTANLALGTAARKRTLAVDLDIGCGNLNTCLGVRFPDRSIDDFIEGRVSSLSDVKLNTSRKRLQLISCSHRPSRSISLKPGQKQQILEDLRYADFDYTFLDLGAGAHADILDFFAAADIKILIITPEALALHNAFAFLKSLIYRTLLREFECEDFLRPLRNKFFELVYSNGEVGVHQMIDRMRSWDRYSAYIIQGLIHELKIFILVNMVVNGSEKTYVTNFYNLVRKYLDLDVMLLGLVPYDARVKESIREIVPFTLEYPHAPAAVVFNDLSLKLEKTLSSQ